MRTVVTVVTVMTAVVLATSCMSPVIPWGGGRTSASERQRQGLVKLFPAQLEPRAQWKGPPRVAKLRVWADAEHRAQNHAWQRRFGEVLADANELFEPMLGVTLEAEYAAWDRRVAGASVEDHLTALAAHDAGEGVVWVVGLVSALSLVSPTFDQLGMAELGGPHAIVRAHADQREREAFERAFPDLGTEERDAVLEARRRHKQAAVLVHELAHSLGALHEADPDGVLSSSYSHRAASITDENRALMLITLEARLAPRDHDPRAVAQQRLAILEGAPGAWDATSRGEAIAHLRGWLAAAGPAGDTAGAATSGARGTRPATAAATTTAPPGAAATDRLPASLAETVDRTEQLLAHRNIDAARAALEPLITAYPAHARLRVLACRIELAARSAGPSAASASSARSSPPSPLPLPPACDRAVELAATVETIAEVAAIRAAAGDPAGARAALRVAEQRAAALPAERAAAAWLALAEHHHALKAATAAEDALAKAAPPEGAEHPIAKWAAAVRARYGVPRAGAAWRLVPDDDAAALAAVQDVIAHANARRWDLSTRVAAAAEQRWPALPGLLAARCDLEMRRGEHALAKRLCERAIAGAPVSWALYMLGILELRVTTPAATQAGIARLRAAIALDPDLSQAWRALGKAHLRARDDAAWARLDEEYRARFGGPLAR